MRHPRVMIDPWTRVRAELEDPFRRIALHALFPGANHDHTAQQEQVRFEQIEEAGNFELTFEIIFKGPDIRQRLTLAGLKRLQAAFMSVIENSSVPKRYPHDIVVEVCCH